MADEFITALTGMGSLGHSPLMERHQPLLNELEDMFPSDPDAGEPDRIAEQIAEVMTRVAAGDDAACDLVRWLLFQCLADQ
jgi:hypothetical protein